MPKPSSNPDKAYQGGGGGIEGGIYQVADAKYMNLKSDFRDTNLNLVLTCHVCDKDGDVVKSADNVEINLSFGAKSLQSFHPGTGKSPADSDPKDEGDAPDAEGNTVYCADDTQFNKSCSAIVFAETMSKAGYPKDVLEQTWAPNYVGFKFELESLDAKSINDKFGTRLNTKPMKDKDGNDRPVTYKVCKKWLNPNYLSGGKDAAKNGTGAAATPAAGGEEKPDYDVMTNEQLAEICLAAVAEARSGDKGTVKTLAQLSGLVTNHYTAKAKMPAARLKLVQAVVKNAVWAQEACENLGATWGDEPNQVVFP